MVLQKTYRNNSRNFYERKKYPWHERGLNTSNIEVANTRPEIVEDYNLKNPKVKCMFCLKWKHIYFIDPHDHASRHNVVLVINALKKLFDLKYPFVCWKCFDEVNKFLYVKVMELSHEGRIDDIYPIVRDKYNVPEGREEDFLVVFQI